MLRSLERSHYVINDANKLFKRHPSAAFWARYKSAPTVGVCVRRRAKTVNPSFAPLWNNYLFACLIEFCVKTSVLMKNENPS